MKKLKIIILVLTFLTTKFYSQSLFLGPTNLIKNEIKKAKKEIDKKLELIFYHVVEDELDDPVPFVADTAPEGIYPYGPTDIWKAYLGTDDEYLYIKIVTKEKLPTYAEKLKGGYTLESLEVGLDIDDYNPQTGFHEMPGEDILLYFHIGYKFFAAGTPEVYYLAEPTGIYWPEEQRYKKYGVGEYICGGPGYNYVVFRFKLSELGLKKGQTIGVSIISEAGAVGVHHYTYDKYPQHGAHWGDPNYPTHFDFTIR